MPRYFIHLFDDEILHDEVGQELADLRAARVAARTVAGELIAEHLSLGIVVDLNHRLEVVNEAGRVVLTLKFAEMFAGAGAAPQLASV